MAYCEREVFLQHITQLGLGVAGRGHAHAVVPELLGNHIQRQGGARTGEILGRDVVRVHDVVQWDIAETHASLQRLGITRELVWTV